MVSAVLNFNVTCRIREIIGERGGWGCGQNGVCMYVKR